MEHKTPLYDCHLTAGAKATPFRGYLLKVKIGKEDLIGNKALPLKS
ncbi:MAG: hypothetical protein GX138_03315 [Firmicutes bacterium]|jgi:glycine cleavage system aminomethyltransferase T|nr:hypothetical protein [Bacillota bacterium]